MRFIRQFVQFGLVLTLVTSGAGKVQATQPVQTDDRGRPLYQSGVLAVKLKSESAQVVSKALVLRFGISSLDAVSDTLDVQRVEQMFRSQLSKARPDLPDISRIYRVTLGDGMDVRRAAILFGRDPSVEYAEPIPFHYLHETPNDPLFDVQWFLDSIEAEGAWDVHKGENGSEVVVVGISDTGVAWRHEDLVHNIFQNLGEDADGDGKVIEASGDSWIFDPDDVNGFDDDGNGYPDDFVGWNFFNDDEQEDNDPDDPDSHGTHVAGLAAGRTNNGVGISSISWNVKILATSASNSESEGIDRGYSSVVYLAENGADVINMSWGSDTTSQAAQDVMDYATGLGSLLVSSAGNDSVADPHYPSALPGVVSVASVGKSDRLATYSNYGISVDVTSPGGAGINSMRSTTPPNNYGNKEGTSMASPVAAGVFALVKSLHPSWSNGEIIEQVLGTADSVDDLNVSKVGLIGEGRINAFRALTDQPATDVPELRLEVLGIEVVDDNGDGSLEAGEGAEIIVTLRNYSHLASSPAVTLTLQTDSPYVEIIDESMVVSVTADMKAVLPSTFSIRVVQEAPSGSISLSLAAEASGASVSSHSELDFTVLVAGGGLLVWEGTEAAPTFSGQYLRDELVSRGFDVTYVTGEFPPGLVGFDGAFLSFGNAGLDPDGPPYSARLDENWKVDAIKNYLERGGRLFLEGSDTLGYDIYEIVDRTDLLPLFGLEGGVDGDETHEIDSLDGHAGALTEGMRFNQTDQNPVGWIDIYTVSTGAEAFTESDYGVVAVQHAGRYGQRTFCFAYTIAELVDGSTTRGDVLDAMIEFFDFGSVGPTQRTRRGGRRVVPAETRKDLRRPTLVD